MPGRLHARLFTLALAASLSGWSAIASAQQGTAAGSITVFAAASMKNALDDINADFNKANAITVMTSYAASSALMKQIENGAPADVFVSADVDWMDYGVARNLIDAQTRINLL